MTSFSKLTFTFVAIAVLAGCAPMNSNFNCNKVGGQGAGCVSLDQVNQMANQGKFNQTGKAFNPSGQHQSDSASASKKPEGYPVATPFPGAPVRYGETVQQLWIAPYQDTDGNFHEPSYLYFVVKSGYWIGVPPEAIQSDE